VDKVEQTELFYLTTAAKKGINLTSGHRKICTAIECLTVQIVASSLLLNHSLQKMNKTQEEWENDFSVRQDFLLSSKTLQLF
jgi:hypothetical protein